ncbi:hypothetical protein EVAR_55295_1 [Eumeta japonica]|uniref:Uncharacterized protein n=1 Tax=Eumeta variegata TaxID=151549 RepID=A0A4C1ZE04_EUMVA|nr:hypothetical protein EVAR_55295_1 [Eumeta japonica]
MLRNVGRAERLLAAETVTCECRFPVLPAFPYYPPHVTSIPRLEHYRSTAPDTLFRSVYLNTYTYKYPEWPVSTCEEPRRCSAPRPAGVCALITRDDLHRTPVSFLFI